MLEVDGRERTLRVAIIGGGIGGLALATFLSTLTSSQDNRLKVDIYEAAPSLTELGAGVGVWLRTWRILEAAASGRVAQDLQCLAPSGRSFTDELCKAFELRRGDRCPEGKSFYTMEVPFGVLTLHRADFQRILAQYAIPPTTSHFNKRLVGYEYANDNDPDSDIILKFSDGSTARTDFLVGADGIRSVVRRGVVHRLVTRGVIKLDSCSAGENSCNSRNLIPEEIISELVEPVWSGTIVYRSLIPLQTLEERFPGHRAGKMPVVYFGKNQHVIAFPITQGGSSGTKDDSTEQMQMVNLVAFVSDGSREGTRLPPSEPWVRPASREEVLSKFGGWEDEVSVLLELVEEPLAWAIHTVRPLPSYSDPDWRVVLLGDAAHAMTPHQGAGGGQAIEDAYVLASLLTHPRLSRQTLPLALKAYDSIRVPISQRVVKNSRANGMMYEFNLGWDEKDGIGKDQGEGGVNGAGIDGHGDEELHRLHHLADAIMEIHKWEWEDSDSVNDWAESQRAQAIRTFEDSLGA